jgi:YD repeat-containing protein
VRGGQLQTDVNVPSESITTNIDDAFGRTVFSRDDQWPSLATDTIAVKYQYDILDNLTTVTENCGAGACGGAGPGGFEQTTDLTYDALKRKLSLNDPDMSNGKQTPWTYAYDAVGNLIQQTDSRGVVTSITYDSLSRVTSKSFDVSATGGTVPAKAATTFLYDDYDTSHDLASPICGSSTASTAIAQLTVMTDSTGSSRWCYDARGQQVAQRRVNSSDPTHAYDILREYDTAGRVRAMTYPLEPGAPSPDVVTYTYDDSYGAGAPSGKLIAMESSVAGPLVTDVNYDHINGSPTEVNWGNGFTTTYDYSDPLDRLAGITTRRGAEAPVQDLDYAYTAAENPVTHANILEINDHVLGEDLFYHYDIHSRLTSATNHSLLTNHHHVASRAPRLAENRSSRRCGRRCPAPPIHSCRRRCRSGCDGGCRARPSSAAPAIPRARHRCRSSPPCAATTHPASLQAPRVAQSGSTRARPATARGGSHPAAAG